MADLSTTICNGKISLSTCIFNASGPRTGSSDALAKVATSASGAVLAKSATLKEQNGNPLPRTWQSDGIASMNSEGLPNKGIDYYLSDATISDSLAGTGKPYILSISGCTLSDNVSMLKMVGSNKAIAAVELNLACPNVIGHPIIAYDMDQLEEALSTVAKLKLDKPLGIKVRKKRSITCSHFKHFSSLFLSHYRSHYHYHYHYHYLSLLLGSCSLLTPLSFTFLQFPNHDTPDASLLRRRPLLLRRRRHQQAQDRGGLRRLHQHHRQRPRRRHSVPNPCCH